MQPHVCALALLVAIGVVGCDSLSDESGFVEVWRFDDHIPGLTFMPPQEMSNGDVLVDAGGNLLRLRPSDGGVVWQAKGGVGIPFAIVDERLFGNAGLKYAGFDLMQGKTLFETRVNDNYPELFSRELQGTATPSLFVMPGLVPRAYHKDFSPAWVGPSLGILYNTKVHSTHYADGRIFAGIWDMGSLQNARGLVLALDATIGDSLWVFEMRGVSILAPLAIHDGVVYASAVGDPGRDVALDATTGRVLWEKTPGGAGSDFVYHEGTLYGYAGLGGAYLYARDAATGRLKWQQIMGGAPDEIVVHNGYVYAVDAFVLRIVDTRSGKIVHEEWPDSGYWENVAVVGDKIIAQSQGAVIAYKPYRP